MSELNMIKVQILCNCKCDWDFLILCNCNLQTFYQIDLKLHKSIQSCLELNESRWLWWSVKSFSDLYSLQTNTSVAAEGCGYVECHETEVPFTHLPKFHISDHKEFLKSNGMEVWLVFSLW